MKATRFIVIDGWAPASGTPGSFILVGDNWDDFTFKTTYTLHHVIESGEVLEIGYVKIASLGTKEGDPRTKLPHEFNQLPENFFSLGQSREYYEAIMALQSEDANLVLNALNDVAADEKLFNKVKNEEVFQQSLIREIPIHTVTTQFKRIIAKQAPLTPYKFYYRRQADNEDSPDLELEFSVNPESTPPTNVHVLVGANGVGKSMILRDMVSIAGNLENALGTLQNDLMVLRLSSEVVPFVNVVHVSYSAFDKNSELHPHSSDIKIHTVGLSSTKNGSLDSQFSESFWICTKEPRRTRLITAIRTLEAADPLLHDVGLSGLLDSLHSVDNQMLVDQFESMSSGHKIAILTVTRLVELVEEQSLVLLDEPEIHLHPPLLSALTRAISDLAIDRNGVAIIATHSPVVLQEVPRSCVWRLQRTGNDLRAFRLDVESFGESVSRLTSRVFHLDIRKTGYHDILQDLIDQTGSVEAALEALNEQLGDEGRFVLNSLAHTMGNKNV
ncbi:MAG: AAA family ATPase [Patescibacteria group bacterium]